MTALFTLPDWAVPPHVQALSGPVSQRSGPGSASVHVQQHALEGHAPCMQGPLQITSAEGLVDSLLSLAQSGDICVGMCVLRCASVTYGSQAIMPSCAALDLQDNASHALPEQLNKLNISQQE